METMNRFWKLNVGGNFNGSVIWPTTRRPDYLAHDVEEGEEGNLVQPLCRVDADWD